MRANPGAIFAAPPATHPHYTETAAYEALRKAGGELQAAAGRAFVAGLDERARALRERAKQINALAEALKTLDP